MTQQTALSPIEKKEQLINSLIGRIESQLTTSLIAQINTCDYSGWNREEHYYMPNVAQRLREKGYTVTSRVRFEVTEWVITL